MSTSSTVRLCPRRLGCPISTRLRRDFLIRSGGGWLDPAAGPRCPAGPGVCPTSRSLSMRVAVMTAPGEVKVEDRADPTIQKPTDAIIRLYATCICGSDLWPYRGIAALDGPRPMGHEYAGIVEEVGSAVSSV